MAQTATRPYSRASGRVAHANARGFKLEGAASWLNYSSIHRVDHQVVAGEMVTVTYETGRDSRLWIVAIEAGIAPEMNDEPPEWEYPEDYADSGEPSCPHGHQGCDGRHDVEDMPISEPPARAKVEEAERFTLERRIADAHVKGFEQGITHAKADISVERATRRAALDAAVQLLAPAYASRKIPPDATTTIAVAEAFLHFMDGNTTAAADDAEIPNLPQ